MGSRRIKVKKKPSPLYLGAVVPGTVISVDSYTEFDKDHPLLGGRHYDTIIEDDLVTGPAVLYGL